jgi:hypothetical protein
MFDAMTPEGRAELQKAIVAKDPKVLDYITELATKCGVHRAYDANSSGCFCVWSEKEEPGIVFGICGGRRFLILERQIDNLVECMQLLTMSSLSEKQKSERALAQVVLMSDCVSHIEIVSYDPVRYLMQFSPDLIVGWLKLREEVEHLRTRLNRSIDIEALARNVTAKQELVNDAIDGDEGHGKVFIAEQERGKAIRALADRLIRYT